MRTLTLILLLSIGSANLLADTWTETFKLPEGTTYRAKAAGYDCGKFDNKYVQAPQDYQNHQVEFKQLSADKDLNKFLFEATYPSTSGESCIYGVFFDRKRESRTLDFTHSEIQTREGNEQDCLITKDFLDNELQSVSYEGSKRGLRYIAAQIMTNTSNDVCESGNVRIVFDRRL